MYLFEKDEELIELITISELENEINLLKHMKRLKSEGIGKIEEQELKNDVYNILSQNLTLKNMKYKIENGKYEIKNRM